MESSCVTIFLYNYTKLHYIVSQLQKIGTKLEPKFTQMESAPGNCDHQLPISFLSKTIVIVSVNHFLYNFKHHTNSTPISHHHHSPLTSLSQKHTHTPLHTKFHHQISPPRLHLLYLIYIYLIFIL
jgi:hypothetical protein